MLDYTKELTIHIQGLGMSFHQAFQEVEEYTPIDIPSSIDIHEISIRKVGGYVPQLVRIIYLDSDNHERQQAYMARYSEGNLVCAPIEEEPIEHPFTHECTLGGYPIGITLHVNSKYINQDGNLTPNEPNKWVAIHQRRVLRLINPYMLDIQPHITYLHT